MLNPQFAAIGPIFNPWLLFFNPWLLFACCMLIFTIMQVAVICLVSLLAGEKGQYSKFFAQLDSMQECSGQQF
jgi:hypothetical protein